MQCAKPYRRGIEAFPCGRCAPCLVNRQSIWSTRLYLESLLHGDSVFITLTFNDEHLPVGKKELRRTLTLFLKRFRKAIAPRRFRYYCCLEYGTRTKRAHFHGILFNVSRFDSQVIDKAWGLGYTQTAECNEKSINYVTKYVTKGDSRAENESEQKTFALMSRNPGIGYGFVQTAGKRLQSHAGANELVSRSDVPTKVRVGNKMRPIGRYLTGKLRMATGSAVGSEPEHRRESRLGEAAAVSRTVGTQRYLQLDEHRRTNSLLKAEFAINLKKQKEKL